MGYKNKQKSDETLTLLVAHLQSWLKGLFYCSLSCDTGPELKASAEFV